MTLALFSEGRKFSNFVEIKSYQAMLQASLISIFINGHSIVNHVK